MASFLHTPDDASLNLPSVTLAPCLLLWSPCLPPSSFICSFPSFSHAETHDHHSLVRCPSALPYQKGWPPLIWRSLIIPCRTGGPLIQPPPSPLASPSGPQHGPPPLSPMVLSNFSGCNCSTINRGGRRKGGGGGGGRGWLT